MIFIAAGNATLTSPDTSIILGYFNVYFVGPINCRNYRNLNNSMQGELSKI